jgi:hypothetical protein
LDWIGLDSVSRGDVSCTLEWFVQVQASACNLQSFQMFEMQSNWENSRIQANLSIEIRVMMASRQ